VIGSRTNLFCICNTLPSFQFKWLILLLLVLCSKLYAFPQIPDQPLFPQDTLSQRDTTRFPQFGFPDQNDTAKNPPSLEQNLKDRKRTRSRVQSDSLGKHRDTTSVEDTVAHWTVYHDSTARIAQFVHHRVDYPMVQLFPKENYSLYLEPYNQVYKREVKLDSTGQFVTIRETVNGLDVKIPITITLEEYIKSRFEYERFNYWRSTAGQSDAKKTKDDLAQLMGSITNISIPIPANPIMNIFGGDKVDLRISGDVDIRAAFRNTKTDQAMLSRYDQTRNEPTFKQDVRINVSGLIGKKLNINADWNTQRMFEYENQLKIKYTGFDDEVIQSVEAGNVSLQTPSLVGGGQALFGIKTKMQMGPLTLTTLLSQKKGQTKEFTISGGSQSSEITIYPYDYSKNHFFLDTLYMKFFKILKKDQIPQYTADMEINQVVQLDVYISVPASQAEQEGRGIKASAYIDLPSHAVGEDYSDVQISSLSKQTDRYFEGTFVRLDPLKDFKYDQFGGHFTLLTSYNDDQVIAVEYEIKGAGGNTRIFGGAGVVDDDTVRLLKLIKPRNLYNNPNYHPAWELLMKNFYSVRASNIKRGNFSFEIWRQTQGAEIDEVENEKLLQVFGLDRFDSTSGERKPDNSFDFLPGFTIDVDRGEVIFPTLRPFDEGIREYFLEKRQIAVDDSLIFNDIYDTTASAAQRNSLKNKYYFKVRASGAQSSRYQLGFNVVEGSVQVLLNGAPLRAGDDYTVDYMTGEVILKNPRALDPGANVSVKYEQNDLFQIAAKTLIGARGEITTFPNTNFGFTIMNLNQETLSDKVRIGEEPTNNLMIGIDASTQTEAKFLTDALNILPFIRTQEMSTLKFGAEAAFMLPDANTKKSTVAGDKGASIAYIDDFEGSRRTIPINIQYPAWSLSSAPVYLPLGSNLADTLKNYRRARLTWYNIPQGATVQDIWPNRRTRPGDNLLNPFILEYNPNRRGIYNFSPNLDSSLFRESIGGNTGRYNDPEERRKNWNGIMRAIGSTAGSILEQNITYIEFWMKATSENIDDLRRGKLYVNLGYISEDIIPNKQLNSEDNVRTPSNPAGIINGVLNPGEDLGLDMLGNPEEVPKYQSFLNSNNGDPDVDPSDPAGDDYFFCMPGNTSCNMYRINGTENNGLAEGNNYPNTEDLNANGSVDLINEYLEYELPLDTVYFDSLGILRKNEYHVGGGYKGWYQFRIPLLDAQRIIGTSTPQSILQNVQYIRMWISGFSEPVTIWFAEIDLLGNQWQERAKNDSLLKISVMSIEENPQYLSEWYQLGITREKDRSDPNNIIEANEQSLSLVIKDLPKDTIREIYRVFTIKPLDLINYKSMKMFVHGDESFEYLTPEIYDAAIYLRFGADSQNFYEYRQPIHRGWDIPNNEMVIDFGELTSIKAERDTVNRVYRVPVPGKPGATYGVRGNPSLRQVKELMIGIVNHGKPLLNGEVWINELRLVDVDNSPGSAFRFDTQVKLADIGSFGFNYSRMDPNYHTLEQRFGNQNTSVNWAFNSTVSLDRLLPANWQGTQIPFGYSHAEQIVKPKYLPNTDIIVDEAASRAQTPAQRDKVTTEAQTLSIKDSYTVSGLKIVPPIKAWYISDTFSRLVFSFNYNTASDRNPSFEIRKSWQWNLGINYNLTLPSDYYIQPFKSLFKGIFLLEDYKDWKFYYVPIGNISAGIGGNRSRSMEKGRSQTSTMRDIRNFGARKNFGFSWKLTEGGISNISGDYGVTLDRNLQPLDNDTVGRDFWSLMKSLFFGGKDSRYGQRFSMNTKPKIPNILDIPKYFDVTLGYSVNYQWSNNFQPGGVGAGYANNINFSLNFKLKSLTDPWFETKTAAPPPKAGAPPRQTPPGGAADTSKQKQESLKPSIDTSKTKKMLEQLKSIAKLLFKIPLLDYENINIAYTQSNRASAGGVLGSNGFLNFWGRLPFQGSRTDYGPSRLFQLGLINDPDGTLKFSPKSKFPFLGWKTQLGQRYPNLKSSDQFSQDNKITLRTRRPLWKDADIELNWNIGWRYTRTTIMQSDSLGRQTLSEPQIGGGIERSFLSIPPVLLFKFFKSGLEDVGKKYDELSKTEPPNKALVKAFEDGLETLPILKKILGPYAPRPNWTLRWSGIERIAGLDAVFERLSLEHNYSSSIRRDYRSTVGKGEQTDAEQIKYGFAPLAGINMTFKKLLKGNFSGNFKYNTTTSYDLNVASSTPNIMSTLAQEISLTLSYSRRGFSLPLFGLDLSNDVEVSVNFSYTKNSRRRYEPQLLTINQEGIPMEGQTRTRLEPRIRYVLSSRVTASLFYSYIKTAPDAAGSRVIGTTSNEAGLDIHISIGG